MVKCTPGSRSALSTLLRHGVGPKRAISREGRPIVTDVQHRTARQLDWLGPYTVPVMASARRSSTDVAARISSEPPTIGLSGPLREITVSGTAVLPGVCTGRRITPVAR